MRTHLPRMRWFCCAVTVSTLALVSSMTRAGDGSVVPGGPQPDNCDDPRSEAEEQCQDGEQPGDLSLSFAFMFPPSQEQADHARAALVQANRILCDVTDGQMRVSKIRWIVGDAAAAQADMRWYFADELIMRSQATGAGELGVTGQHVAFMKDFILGDVAAHELSHYLFRLFDTYPSAAEFQGPGFDGEPFNGIEWVPTDDLYWGGFLRRRLLPRVGDAEYNVALMRNNSIMQQAHGYYCSNSDGWSPSQVDPLFSHTADVACVIDADCPDPLFDFCPLVPSVMSELSIATNFDQVTGPGTPPTEVRESRELVFAGLLPTTPCSGEQDYSHFDGTTPDHNEECENPGGPEEYTRAGYTCTTTCLVNCLYDLTDCLEGPPPNCGDGVVQSPEQCDGDGPLACSDLASWLVGGSATCGPHCFWDRSQCQIKPVAFSQLRIGIHGMLPIVFMDSQGDWQVGPMEGRIYQHPQPHSWVITLAIGASTQMAVYKLDFDPGSGELTSVNGLRPLDAGGGDPNPVIVLGTPTGPEMPEGTEYGDAGFSDLSFGGQIEHTGEFSNGAPPVTLEVRFENLREEDATDAFGVPVADQRRRLFAYTRHGVVDSGPQAGKPIPPGKPCDVAPDLEYEWCEMAWSDETSNWETTCEAQVQLRTKWYLERQQGTSWEQFKSGFAESIANGTRGLYLTSEWDRAAAYLLEAHGLTLDVPSIAVEATFDAAGCPDPVFEPEALSIDEPDRIILALDKSGSMGQPLPFTWTGTEDITRLDYAKSSARMFLQRQLMRNTMPDVGLVWYDAPSQGLGGLYPLADAQPRTLQAGSVAGPDATREQIEDALESSDVIGREDLVKFMTIGVMDGEEYPAPGGMTAIGDVLEFAGGLLPEASSNVQAIVLLSDGEETALQAGLSDNDPVEVARELRGRGVQVYSLALGYDADGLTLSEVAANSAGPYWNVRDPRELPGAFFECYAQERGEALVRSVRTPVVSDTGGGEFPDFQFEQTLPVEPGAQRLVVLLSYYSGDLGTWPPAFQLRDPGNSIVEPAVYEGPMYRLLEVWAPAQGLWSLHWSQSQSLGPTPANLVTAHVENPLPDCFAGFNAGIVRSGEAIRLSVEPEFGGFSIAEGAVVTAVVRRPDYSEVELDVPFDRVFQRYWVEFPVAELLGRGSYEATVRCTVADGASVRPGESFGQSLPAPDVTVVGFTRETSARFFYDTDELPPLPGPGTPFADDCDGDNIPNDAEPEGDADGDGAPNVCDGDADGDDVPDGIDPDPYTHHHGCMQFPPTIGCCATFVGCRGGGFALYADAELRLADRTWVYEADGTPAEVANAGFAETNIGTDNLLGHVWSVASVTLRERAYVDGSVWTSGELDEQNWVTVTGNRRTGVPLTFPPIEAFAYDFQPEPLGPVQLEPGDEAALPPGRYSHIDIKAGATLRLTSGMHEVESLMMHPGSHLDVDTSTGPLYVYSRGTIVVRGMLPGTAEPEDLLFASFGAQDVVIEAPFKGTVVAPNARTIITGGWHEGAFFARYLQVNPDAFIEHRAFRYDWPHASPGPCGNGVRDQDETDVDCGGLTCGPCPDGSACAVASDCESGNCSSGVCQPAAGGSCSEEVALDLGRDGENVTVANDACVMVRDQYPSWWGTRTMMLQNTAPGAYPVPFTWSNSCAQASGAETFTGDWQSKYLGPISDQCATIIDFQGTGGGTITVRYYAN